MANRADERLGRLANTAAHAAPSAHLRAACAARRAVPLAEGNCRVVVAAPRASLALDLTRAELRRELSGSRSGLDRYARAVTAMATLVLRDEPWCLSPAPAREGTIVRQVLGYLDDAVLCSAPPGWNTLGLDVDVAGGEVRVRPVVTREAWTPLLSPPLLARRPKT